MALSEGIRETLLCSLLFPYVMYSSINSTAGKGEMQEKCVTQYGPPRCDEGENGISHLRCVVRRY